MLANSLIMPGILLVKSTTTLRIQHTLILKLRYLINQAGVNTLLSTYGKRTFGLLCPKVKLPGDILVPVFRNPDKDVRTSFTKSLN